MIVNGVQLSAAELVKEGLHLREIMAAHPFHGTRDPHHLMTADHPYWTQIGTHTTLGLTLETMTELDSLCEE